MRTSESVVLLAKLKALPPAARLLVITAALAELASEVESSRQKPISEPERFLTVAEVAARLNVKEPQVYELVQRRLLPVAKLGKRKNMRVRPEDLERFIAERIEAGYPAALQHGGPPSGRGPVFRLRPKKPGSEKFRAENSGDSRVGPAQDERPEVQL